jgi:serine/threonine protein kinase
VIDVLGIKGSKLADYRIDECLNTGAFAVVYQALDVVRNREVALKILHPTASLGPLGEFYREGELLLKLANSSRVVNYMGSDNVLFSANQGSLSFPLRFHILELGAGDLSELLVAPSLLPWTARLALFRDAVWGLHQMHLKKIVHRDLKASNCLLFRNGSGLMVKVSDLGRARHLSAPPNSATVAYQGPRGDPLHAPPELLWEIGEDKDWVHLCADLYGLGSLLVELALGQSMTVMANMLSMPPINSGDEKARRAKYYAQVPSIRSQFESVFAQVELDMPASIRDQGGQLLRRLCDPDPMRRLQQTGFARGGLQDDGAHWVLRRVDVLRLSLRNALAEQARLARKKGFRS